MQQEKDLKCLDELIADLGGSNEPEGEAGPVRFVVRAPPGRTAGSSRLNASRVQFESTASEGIRRLYFRQERPDRNKKILRSLIDSEVKQRSSVAASGMFYPARFRSPLRFEPVDRFGERGDAVND